MSFKVKVYYKHQTYEIETAEDESLETLAAQISGITEIDPSYQTLLIENYNLPLDLNLTLKAYDIQNGQTIVVLGSQQTAADPNAKLSEQQIAKLEERVPMKHPVGIVNKGNFCYLIAAMQALYSFKQVREYILGLVTDDSVLAFVKELFEQLQEKVTQPSIFKVVNQFIRKYAQFQDVRQQYDSQEALSCMEQLISDKMGESLFTLITTQQQLNFIPLNIQQSFMTVNDSIQSYFGTDQKITKLPKILQLHMLRYQFDKELKKAQKISRKLAFQLTFHLNDYLENASQSTTFTLRAVIAHLGMSTADGHYVCYAKHGKKWFFFDDQNVQTVEEDAIYALAGGNMQGFLSYVLLYEMDE